MRHSTYNSWFLGLMLPLVCACLLPGIAHGQQGLKGGGKSVLVSSTAAARQPPAANGEQHFSLPTGESVISRSPMPEHAASDSLVLPLHDSMGGVNHECQYPEPFWMPLIHWKHRLFRHSDPNDPLRHMGLGVPLQGTSWRNRPFSFGGTIGGVWGDQLTNEIDQGEELLGGYRLGYDFDHYWGSELRMAWNNFDLTSDTAALDPSGYLHYDLNLLYYPWGDSQWRPFAGLGLGGARITFTDEQDVSHKEHVVTLPLQIGVKYQYCKWLALRFELTDNLALGNDDVHAMHNLSLTSGVELRFGGWRRSYFPWSPKTAGW